MKIYDQTCKKPESKKEKLLLRSRIAVILIMLCVTLSSKNVFAASYSGDYRYWSQGGSDYTGMREVGCLITAQAKMLYEANVNRSASFNPDVWYNWLLSNGGIASSRDLNMRDHNAPANYAKSLGKNLNYLGYWKADDAQLWYNINAGYYTIVHVSGTNTGGSHFVLLDNALSKQKGALYCYDSFSDRGNVSQQLLSRYSIHNGGHVYSGNNAVHSHNYSSRITKQPTCTQTGVKTYSCSCGSSYTETIKATGHSYTEQIIAPTMTEKGYTLHTCSSCKNTYKDNYVDPPKSEDDGWHYCNDLPAGISSGKYTIQYRNHYEKIQASSPGTGWQNAGIVKDEWKNAGNTYTSVSDLPVSNSRVLVRSVYYHFCGPNTGAEGNYAQTDRFVHYDEIPSTSVTARYLGTDNGHPYYFINWIDGGGQVWCKSGVSCNGSYGSHGNRCRAWYKMNTYQNKIRNVQYKFTKTSDWTDTKDASATSVQIRFKNSEPEKQEKPDSTKTPDTPIDAKKPVVSDTSLETEEPDVPDTSLEIEDNTSKIGTSVTASGCRYKIISENEATLVSLKNKKQASVRIPATIKYEGRTYKIISISNNAFYKNKRLKKIIIKSPYLKSIGKNSIKGIYKKAIIKCPKKQFRIYKKMFNSKTGYKKSMKIKG